MAFWLDIAAFALKALLIVAAVGGLAVLIARLARSGEAKDKDKEIKVRSLNERYDDMRDAMNGALLDKKERKALARTRKKEAKAAVKARRGQEPGKRIYVLGFKGDMRASAVKRLGSEIDAVLIAARPGTDEAVIRIESPGGTVTGYGLAAAEILRLREHKIKVTASVDQVAASGGYMMACAADRIVAAPFAVVGSIGVVAPVPNLHRLLQKNEIDFEEMTAGDFKRTVSVLGEITPAGREHFRGKLDATHEAFKAHVAQCRPNVDMAKVANGDYWLAREALGLGLVDELSTGDELLFRVRDSARLYEVSTEVRKTLLQRYAGGPSISAASSIRRTRRSKPMSMNAVRTSTWPRSPTAIIGWLARRSGLASSMNSRPATSFLFRVRDSARLYEVSTEARKTLLQQLLGGFGVAARKMADVIAGKLGAL